MQSSVASLNNLNNEDLVAALQAFSNQYLHSQVQAGDAPTFFNPNDFKSHFLSELYRTIGVRVDYSIDPQLQQLLQSTQGLTLQRCLSVQAALGYAGGSHRPSLSAILAWTILNVRSIVMVSMGTMSRKPGVENELSRPGMSGYKILINVQKDGSHQIRDCPCPDRLSIMVDDPHQLHRRRAFRARKLSRRP